MKNILIVDDEKTFLLSLTDGLSSIATDFNVLTASNGVEAIEVLESVDIDLLVTDLKMPVMDGFQLIAYIASKHLDVPLIVITAFGTPELENKLYSMGALHYLEKPLDFNVLFEKIKELLSDSAKGYISGITLPAFLQLLEIEKKTCTLNLKSSEHFGRLFFLNGVLIDAETGDLSGEDAAYEIVCWDDVNIGMMGGCSKNKKKINMPLNNILIDACRIMDEQGRVNSERGDKTEKDEELIFDIVEPEGVEDTAPNKSKEDFEMSVQEKLSELSSMDGFAGVGVFTPTGEALGMVSSDKLNLKEIGVLANNVLMNAQKASLDMGTGRGQLVHVEAERAHIIVRCLNEGTDPLKSQPGKAHIHLVLILTNENSIGLAKMKVGKVIESLAPEFRL
jgi:DNA-binding response OmpR family regulator